MVVPVGVVRDTGFREKVEMGLVGVVRSTVLELGGVGGGVGGLSTTGHVPLYS